MDRKSILVLIVCFVLLLLWGPIVNRIYPPIPVETPAGATNQVSTTTRPAAGPETAAPTGPVAERPPAITAPRSPVERWTEPDTPEEILTLETPQARYHFTSHGGALRKVELKDYPAEIQCRGAGTTNGVGYATLNAHARVPALALFGGEALEDHRPFVLRKTDRGVVAEKLLSNGLALIKEFVPSSNHVLLVTLRLENRTNQPVALPETELTIGTSIPLNLKEQPRFQGVQYFDGRKAHLIGASWFANHLLGCGCLPGTPRYEFRSEGVSNIVWASVPNRFFTMIAAPEQPAYQLRARKVEPLWPEAAELGRRRPVGYEAALVYPAIQIPAGAKVEQHLTLYAGPKDYNTLAGLGKSQDLAMNFTTIFGWFAKLLLLSMKGIHSVGLSYGATIIAITFIIKLLFWPLTRASTRSMKRMQALQPQMKAIQEKYKDDPRKMNMKLMEFMKEN
ncbi:MAG: hypothetical protein D6766_10335, partial [Verrucomicrobia bacterium]